jgi:hypothetical protein
LDIQPLEATNALDATEVFSATIAGSYPMALQWQFNGVNLVDNSNVSGSHTGVLTLSNLPLGAAGSYQLLASNSLGTNASSAASLTVVSIGFGVPDGWNMNGNAGTFSGNSLTLTEGAIDLTMSAFWRTPQNIDDFVASWTYQETQLTADPSDGFAFILQNSPAGQGAIGGNLADLGYSGITNSVALEFSIATVDGVGMALGLNGVYTGYADNPTGPVSLETGDPIAMTVVYAGSNLSLTMTDTVSGASYTTNYTVNIPAYVGSNLAYVGFSGATGANYSVQTVSNFTFFNFPTLTAKKGAGGTLILTWPANENSVLQQNTNLASTNWINANVTPSVVNGVEQATVTPGGAALFYRLALPIP